jgi:hypothetical protein
MEKTGSLPCSISLSQDCIANTMAGSGQAKVKRAERRLTSSSAECLAQNLQWRQAATRKTVATRTALMPPTIATARHRQDHSDLPDCGSYDQYPKDPEADRFADQAHSSRDPLEHLSAEHPVGRFDFRL